VVLAGVVTFGDVEDRLVDDAGLGARWSDEGRAMRAVR
jgi:hypothetical protein